MHSNIYLKFFDSNPEPEENVISVHFDEHVKTLEQALAVLESRLGYPDGCLQNINAALDILSCNFYQKAKYQHITIYFDNLPLVKKEELIKFINILNTSIYSRTQDYYEKHNAWAKKYPFSLNDGYILDIYFPSKYRKMIEEIIPEDAVSWAYSRSSLT